MALKERIEVEVEPLAGVVQSDDAEESTLGTFKLLQNCMPARESAVRKLRGVLLLNAGATV